MSKKIGPGMAFDMKKLNKFFAVISVVFFSVVMWLFLDDFVRPWKGYQIQALKIKRDKISESVKKLEAGLDKNSVADLENKLAAAKVEVAGKQEEIQKVMDDQHLLSRDKKKAVIINGEYNALVAETTFIYENAHAHHKPNAHSLFVKLREYKRLFAESKEVMKSISVKEKELEKKYANLNLAVTTAEKNLKKLTGALDLTKQSLKKTEMDLIFAVRNAPFVDYLDPTLKIKQIVLDDITDDRYFRSVPKVDRCITCHAFIDQTGYEKQLNPFKTHPRLDLILGKNSPHPMKKIGCTTCHGGEGHRVNDFKSIAHTPKDAEQAAKWSKQYGWKPPHNIAQPMLKTQHTEGSCLKCHTGVESIPGGTIVNEGRRNIEKFGCYGCHKIEGWEHKRKPAPSLKKIASKVDKDFFKSWVWNPKSFNKHTTMPSFFNQMNNSKEVFQKKNIAEINAMAEFIWSKSENYRPFMTHSKGNVSRGKELVKNVGCLGCHGIEGLEDESQKVNAYAGPYLTGLGSKLSADWLVSWLKKPSHYQENTIMPSFRLTNNEANDIASYLLSFKNKTFENLKFEKLNRELRDEVLMTYYSAFDTRKVAKMKLDKLSDHEKTMDLGERSVGKYGCYSCHDIAGFEGRAPIGPELTNMGSKPLSQFGFGHEKVAHAKDAWIHAHLKSPRRWDNGVDKPFKDLLRMPNFDMSEREAFTITASLLGQVSEFVPLRGMKMMTANEKIVAQGMKTVNKFNCQGCHEIDGVGGDILKMYEDDLNEAPPRLVGQGHRVQADWFHHFLDNVTPIRPWLSVRMPSFNLSNDERNSIVSLFAAKANQGVFEDNTKAVHWKVGERAAAVDLFNKLECASCHTQGFNNDEATAPDLRFAKRRLRHSWIKKWLEEPQKIIEGTTMPSFWEDGEPMEPGVLGGDPKAQIEALAKYLQEIGYKNFN
jgi:mono/diheme cytochrome c family protein